MPAGIHHPSDGVEAGGDGSGISQRRRACRGQQLRARLCQLCLQRVVAGREGCLGGALPEDMQQVLVPSVSGHDSRDRDQGVVAGMSEGAGQHPRRRARHHLELRSGQVASGKPAAQGQELVHWRVAHRHESEQRG